MATLTLRDFDEGLKEVLRLYAAKNGRSLSEEVQVLLNEALERERKDRPQTGFDLMVDIRRKIAPIGFMDLEFPKRDPMPDVRKRFPKELWDGEE